MVVNIFKVHFKNVRRHSAPAGEISMLFSYLKIDCIYKQFLNF